LPIGIINIYLQKRDVLKAINKAGAISVLAHPYKLELKNEELYSFLKEMVDMS
jgi:hypothetical protein